MVQEVFIIASMVIFIALVLTQHIGKADRALAQGCGRPGVLPWLGLGWEPRAGAEHSCLTEINELKAFQVLSKCEKKEQLSLDMFC